MLDSYRPNVAYTFVRHPGYFAAGMPYIERIEVTVDEDNASRIASFLAGKYDLGWENPGIINRTDWVQIKDALKQKRPNLKTAEFPANVMSHISMRTDQKPFGDVRVRQAMSYAIDRQGILDATAEGVGVFNPPAVPAALKEWTLPIDQLGEGAKYYKHDPKEAKRLLAAAGYPNGFPATMCFTTYGSTVLVDSMELVVKYLKDVGIDARVDQKEYGAYAASCLLGKFDSMTYGPQTPFLDPDNFINQYVPGEPKNQSQINDPVVTDMIVRQRRTFELGKRREVIHEMQRYLAKQQYYVQIPSGIYVAVWDGALKNYGPNVGYDYGGRLVAAWLDR
jgi:ABC-type transport system substrate-binding protein